MSEQNRSRRKRFRSSPASTAEYFEIGAPRTSGHQAGGKQKNGGRFIDDVAYNFREGFSEAPDSLANVKGTSTSEKLQYNEHLRKIKERAKLLPKDKHPNDTKSKKKKCKEEPLEVAMREQSGASSRREARTSLFGSRNERDGSEMDDDDDEDEVQEISKRYLQPRRPDSRDTSKPTTTPWTDNFLIPKKKTRNSFGLKGAPREKGSNNDKWNQESKMLNPHYSIDMSSNEVARNKRSASRKNSKSAAIDLCSDGETDSEDIDADHSTYRHRASSRTTHNADEIDKHPGKYEANNEEKHIAETVATIKNDQPYAPQISLNFFKAPSSSEGRNIQDAVALSDKSVSTERKSPVRRAFDLLKNSWMGKKSANAAQRIVPGATLESNRPQIRSGRPLESNNTRNPSVASLESNKTFTSNGVSRASRSTGLFLNDSSDDSCDPLPKLRSKDKSASKKRNKNHKDDSSDDYSPANTSNRERATLSPIYRTRSSARKKISRDSGFVKHKTNEVVDMLEDSDDEQNTLACFDVARIAIGSSVKHHDCQIKIFHDGILSCSYSFRSKERIHNIDFAVGEVEEVHYYIDNTVDIAGRLPNDDAAIEPGSFIALKVQKTKSNGFSSVSSYVPGGSTEENGLIVAEFRSDADIATFMRVVQENKLFSAVFSNESRLIRDCADLYSKALVADAKKEALNRNKRVRSSNRIGFLAGKTNNDLLLRFPFGGDPRLIDAAAKGLPQLHCPGEDEPDSEAYQRVTSELRAAKGNEDTRRRHNVEIIVEDFERLDPGVYLNDTLIDFFLQWMTRKHTLPDLHVFTTHFYTALEDNGAEGVSNWTTKKKIDVFKLRFIYIPINKALHWSFCVVVNPGHILSHLERQKGSISGGGDPMPCLLFFDSLKMHQKDRVHRNVMKWLNAEWLRLEKSPIKNTPFDRSSFPVFTPKVTYQNNSWDCGVFVCRYASGIFQLRDRVFSYNELLGERGDVIKMITYGDEFNFSLDDIADLREEMKILIERLSTIYLPWRAKVDQEEIFEKIVESKAKSDPNASSQESGSGSQLLPTPRPSTDECTDMHPCLLKEGIHHDSPNSLVTQHDFGAFENRIAKENVDTEPKRSRISETTGVSKDYGARHVDKSPSHWRHVADEQRASLSNFNSEQLDAASI